jgi:hypothetical protein
MTDKAISPLRRRLIEDMTATEWSSGFEQDKKCYGASDERERHRYTMAIWFTKQQCFAMSMAAV